MLRTTFTTALKSRCLSTRYTAAANAALKPVPLRVHAIQSSSLSKPWQRSFSSFSALQTQFRQADQSSGLLLSDQAVKQLLFMNQRDNDPDQMLRILVDSGGCHGYQNKLDLTSKVEEDDIVFERDGARVVIDNVSLQFLKGSTVDFVEELIGSTFQVVSNPNAKHTCGCNISYDIDLDMITQN
ncbi:[4Fe-4S] proteins maturation [Umbelopsis sp. WA50703]